MPSRPPSSASSGTSASSNWISPVSEARMPSFLSLEIEMLLVGQIDTNRLIASLVSSGRVRAATSMKSAIGALEM